MWMEWAQLLTKHLQVSDTNRGNYFKHLFLESIRKSPLQVSDVKLLCMISCVTASLETTLIDNMSDEL